MFLPLDPALIMMTLDDDAKISGANSNFFEVNLTKDFSIVVEFNYNQKRIGVSFRKGRTPVDMSDLREFIRKRTGVMYSSKNRHMHNVEYEFKYTEQNCKRITKMLQVLFTSYFENREAS